tara:strand:+ start:871 stop:993 length:123 start_codon:yes stop_codon:yes gene_type:complete
LNLTPLPLRKNEHSAGFRIDEKKGIELNLMKMSWGMFEVL